MKESLRRIVAIVRADFLIRFRRPSTVVVFLLLSFIGYVVMPVVGILGRRPIQSSAGVGLTTALLATFFVGIVGFYVTSNAVERDVVSRCGFVIASTTIRTREYIIGKFIGNVVFLGAFTAGFVASSMVTFGLRHGTALDPWLFVRQYLLVVPSAIVFVAVMAVVFEAVPFLSGRAGDVLYFFLWSGCSGVSAFVATNGSDVGVARYLDVSGFDFVFAQVSRAVLGAGESIAQRRGGPPPLFAFPALVLEREWILPRIVSIVAPLLLLVVAFRSFHRFDPARLRSVAAKRQKGWMTLIDAACRPLTRVLFALDRPASRKPSVRSAAFTDARMTIASRPALLVGALGTAIATVASPANGFARGVLPVAFAVAGLAVADISCRERRAGTLGLIHSAPRLKAGFLWWKLMSTTLIVLAFLAIPVARVTFLRPLSAGAFGIGIFLTAAVATSFGVISSNPKTFVIVLLMYLYVVASDAGRSPALDFAGFYGTATPAATLTYAAIALGAIVMAQAVHAVRVKRA